MTDYAEAALTAPKQLSLRCAVRLLSLSRMIERRIDQIMRAHFNATISRFDLLATLARFGPLTLSELSERLLVSNGNITGLAHRARADGLVDIQTNSADRRARRVVLTVSGRRLFRRMAHAHAACIDRLMSDLDDADMRGLIRLLDLGRRTIAAEVSHGEEAHAGR